jgi:predicted enzyme related to lactoylglutathione lyase
MATTTATAAQTGAFIENGLVHFELACPNVEVVSAFYVQMFGWTIEPKGPGYLAVKTPDGSINGGLKSSDDAYLSFGVVVSDLDKSLADAVQAGGKVALPKTDNGWVIKAQILDPAGNRITLIQGGERAKG